MLAPRIGVSPTYLNALEVGKHPFSAALVLKLSKVFGVPLSRIIGDDSARQSLSEDWKAMFEVLPRRDQAVVLDLTRKLTSWAKTIDVETTRRHRPGPGMVVSFEGIDGSLLRRLASGTKAQLAGELPTDIVSYDHQSELWRHMRARLGEQAKNPLERTLLFACECLQRQETLIRPALREDRIVLTQFFAMASTVYRELDGGSDRQLIDILESHLVKPDLVVMVYSSPAKAAEAATKGLPRGDQFYSPYSQTHEFERALEQYRKIIDEFSGLEHAVRQIELDDIDDRALERHIDEHARVVADMIRELRGIPATQADAS